jgi:hypothetical protein
MAVGAYYLLQDDDSEEEKICRIHKYGAAELS